MGLGDVLRTARGLVTHICNCMENVGPNVNDYKS